MFLTNEERKIKTLNFSPLNYYWKVLVKGLATSPPILSNLIYCNRLIYKNAEENLTKRVKVTLNDDDHTLLILKEYWLNKKRHEKASSFIICFWFLIICQLQSCCRKNRTIFPLRRHSTDSWFNLHLWRNDLYIGRSKEFYYTKSYYMIERSFYKFCAITEEK